MKIFRITTVFGGYQMIRKTRRWDMCNKNDCYYFSEIMNGCMDVKRYSICIETNLSKYINNYTKSDKKYSIIELGCGGSSYLPYLQKKYKNLQSFGIDKSQKGCKSTNIILNENTFSGSL